MKFLAEMIAADLQPYAIVENEGFRCYSAHLEPQYVLPSRRLLSLLVIPEMFVTVKDKAKDCLQKASQISFTTDTWTEPCTTKAFTGVSAHWIGADWQRTFAIITSEEFSGKHTEHGDRIAAKFEAILAAWDIPRSACHVVMRDNDMTTAFNDAAIPNVG
jgi:hypothetical protein